MALITQLVERDLASQVLLSVDMLPRVQEAKRVVWDNRRLTDLFSCVIPALRRSGLTEKVVRLMMFDNPKCYLFNSQRPAP